MCLHFQANGLEWDASEVLAMVRSIKETHTPINWLPPEVPSLIPSHNDTRRRLADQPAATPFFHLPHYVSEVSDLFTHTPKGLTLSSEF